MINENKKFKAKGLLFLLLGLILAGFYIFPLYIMLINTMKTPRQLIESTLALPKSFNFSNYITAFEKMNYGVTLRNSLIVTLGSVILIIIFSSLAAWTLVRNKRKASNIIFFMFVAAMVIPFQSVMLPLVKVMGKLHFLNIAGLMFIYLGFGSSLSIFLYHGFIKTIPVSLDEAALLDGCSKLQIFTKIIFPILKPIHVTVIILNSIWIWNDYLLPSLTINKVNTKTIPLQLFYFFGEYSKQWYLALPALTMSILPIIVFYFFAQKQIIKGVVDGAIK